MSDDLITWLRLQLDEDARVAKQAPPGRWSTSGPDTIAEWVIYDEHWAVAEARAYVTPTTILPHKPQPETYIDGNATAAHIARWDPARVLAEVAAKRRILDEAEAYIPELEHGDNGEWALGMVVRVLALPYAQHPDYKQEWTP